TVTLGTLIDAPVAAFEKLTPKQLQSAAGPPPALQKLDAKLPQLLPQGPGDAIQTAANPCFVSTGVPSSTGPCPNGTQPSFDGTQAYYNSGWLDKNAKFTVQISKSTAPGT